MSEIPLDEEYENLIVRTLESAGFTNEQAEALSAELQLLRGDMETVIKQVHQEQDDHVTRAEYEEHSRFLVEAANTGTELAGMIAELAGDNKDMMGDIAAHAQSLNEYMQSAVETSENVVNAIVDLRERVFDLENQS